MNPTDLAEARRLRMVALYHNCLSSAAFNREDALKEQDPAKSTALRHEASAFESVAGWLKHASEGR